LFCQIQNSGCKRLGLVSLQVHEPDVSLSSLDCKSDPMAVDGYAKRKDVTPRTGCEHLMHPFGLAVDEMDFAIVKKEQPPIVG
jgi:hypothetical protein